MIQVRYIGRKSHRELALLLLNAGPVEVTEASGQHSLAGPELLIVEAPFPGALRVPAYVRAIIPLKRPVASIEAEYGAKLWRVVRRAKCKCHVRRAASPEAVTHIDEAMLRPYASERYGPMAVQLSAEEVQRTASHKFGRLDVLYEDDQAVACFLGLAELRRGRSYWNALRFGFPQSVFSDPKRLHEFNSMNLFSATEWAINNGFDFLDIGQGIGRPDDGTLSWKRRRGGWIDASFELQFFFVRLPNGCEAEFLWKTPVFSSSSQGLSLHIGIPNGPTVEEIAARYREMGFGGLCCIQLHCHSEPSTELVDALKRLYSRYEHPPEFRTNVNGRQRGASDTAVTRARA